MKKLLHLFLFVIISILVVKLTTFGFRPSSKYTAELSAEERQSVDNLKNIVHHLAVTVGNRNYAQHNNLEKAADYITKKFDELGYEVTIETFTAKGRKFKNIIAQIPQEGNAEKTIIVGAHYDSCFNPGADDNASGVAVLMEVARLLKDKDVNRNIKFIAFPNEEPPFFMTEEMGSGFYVRKAKERGETFEAVIILEMVGYFSNERGSQRYLPLMGPFYPNRGNFLAVVGNFPSWGLVNKFTKGFRQSSKFPLEAVVAPSFIPGINWSDHWSFWNEGYPAVMLTDTAFLRNPHYHKPTDLPPTLDYERMAKIVYALRDTLEQLNNHL